MARAPLLQLADISLTFGGDPVFSDLSLVVQPGDRVALVGRNGSGKSTLMKVMAGMIEPDQGERILSPGVSTGYMEQHPDLSGFATLGDFAASGLPEGEAYKVERVAEGLKFRLDADVTTASGQTAGGSPRVDVARRADQPPRHRGDPVARGRAVLDAGRIRADFPRPGILACAHPRDALDRPGRCAAAGKGLREL
jgi:ATP-binding cassette subfamily F protein uup